MLTSEKTATEIVQTIYDILGKADGESHSPTDNIIAIGNCLVTIGESLRGMPVQDARRIIKAAAIMHDIRV